MPKRVQLEFVMGGESVLGSWTHAPISYRRTTPGGRHRKHNAYIDEIEIRTQSYDAPPQIERIVIRVEPGESIDLAMLDQVMPRVLESVDEIHALNHGVVSPGTSRTDLAAHMSATPDPEATRQRTAQQRSRRDLTPAFIHEIVKRRNELVEQGVPIYRTLSAEYHVSEKTIEKWLEIARHEYGLLEPSTRRGKGKRNGKR